MIYTVCSDISLPYSEEYTTLVLKYLKQYIKEIDSVYLFDLVLHFAQGLHRIEVVANKQESQQMKIILL